MFQFFKKKSAPKREMAAVADGQVVPMNEATDPVFSSCALGGGVVIHPEGELIVAPDDGTITATMDGSNHAIGSGIAKWRGSADSYWCGYGATQRRRL